MVKEERMLGYLTISVVLIYVGLRNIGDMSGQVALLVGIVILLAGIGQLIYR